MKARRLALRSVLALALAVWCGWASGLGHSTGAAFAAWTVELLVVVGIDLLMWRGRTKQRWAIHLRPTDQPWPRHGEGGTKRSLAGTAPWTLLVLVVVAWEVLGIDTGPHRPHLTISALSDAFRPLAGGVLLVWLLVGLGYGAARARAPVDPGPGGPSTHRVLVDFSGAMAIHRQVGDPPALLLPADRGAGVAFWLAVVVASVLVDLMARGSHGRLATAEEFLRFISGPILARIALPMAWAYAGWHLFAH